MFWAFLVIIVMGITLIKVDTGGKILSRGKTGGFDERKLEWRTGENAWGVSLAG